jgi:hypothetical protein
MEVRQRVAVQQDSCMNGSHKKYFELEFLQLEIINATQ